MSMLAAGTAAQQSRLGRRIEIGLIGGFTLCCDGEAHGLAKRKACAILAYLVLSGQTRETRGRLSTLLWSDSDEEHARASLRQSIRDLRQIELETGVEFLAADKLTVGIDPAALKTDLSDLQRALEDRDFAAAESILAGAGESLCADLQDCDPVFDNWIRTVSTNWSDGIVDRLAKSLEEPGLIQSERKAAAACILRLDPFHELAATETMLAAYREGGYARARVFFERYSADLRAELDLAPPRAMVRRLEQMRSSDGAADAALDPAPGAAAAPASEMPTIVIVTEACRPDDAHIQFALVSELSASLSRFRHWTVIRAKLDRGASRAGAFETLREAAGGNADLAVVIAAPDEAGGRGFEIACRDLATGRMQFGVAVPSEPAAWKTVFNEVCAQVASRLQVAISTARLHRIDEQSPNYVSAYDSWLDGQRLSILWRSDTEAAAIARYEDAIRQDPRLACAYSSLAAVLNSRWIVLPGYPLDSADLERAFELARKAVTLDPLDHRNQVNLAWSHLLARRWELADFHFGLAHDLNAANPATLIAYSLASAFMGEHARAVELARRSFQLNPLHEPHYHGYHASIAFLAGDLDACIASVEKSDDLFPDIRGWSAAAHALAGDEVRAGTDFRMFLRSVSEAWHDRERPSRRAVIDWFRNVFPIRLDADRERLAEGIERAARLA